MRAPVTAETPRDIKDALLSLAAFAPRVAGRLLLVASLLPVGLPCLRCPEPPLQVVMEASRGQRPLPAEPQRAGSSHATHVPISRQESGSRFHAEIGRLSLRLAIVRSLLWRSHVPEVGRIAPDPPHLSAAPWRAPPHLPA